MKIAKTYELPYSLASVYDAWVSSNTVIAPATSMDIRAKKGGHYRLIMATPEFTGTNEGEFLLVEPYARLVYTWEWNSDGEISTVDVVFTHTDTGTRINLTHTGFCKEESVARHHVGWDSYIAGLTTHLSV